MANIRVYPHLSPRVIEIQSPTTEITIQELTDLIKDWEDEPPNLTYPILVRTFGKQSLGGGSFVGITAVLQNAKVSFEARSGPDEVLCTISGGNLVAEDDVGASISPIHPTAYTQVVIAQSTAPSIITPPEDLSMLYLIESLRGTSKSLGSIIYWDPENGDNANDGSQPSDAVATFAQAQSLATAGAGDIIFAVASASGGVTTTTETLSITKAGLKVRGAGYRFQLAPGGSGSPTVNISADSVELEGFYITTDPGGTDNGITISSGADNALIKDCWVNSATGNGVEIGSAARTKIDTCAIEDCTGNGIQINDSTTLATIRKCIISGNADGVELTGSSSSDNIFENNLIYNNSAYGIDIGSGVSRTGVRLHHTFSGNTSGSTRDLGTQTFIETPAGGSSATDIADAVWDELINDHQTSGSAGKTLKDTKTKATLASLK